MNYKRSGLTFLNKTLKSKERVKSAKIRESAKFKLKKNNERSKIRRYYSSRRPIRLGKGLSFSP